MVYEYKVVGDPRQIGRSLIDKINLLGETQIIPGAIAPTEQDKLRQNQVQELIQVLGEPQSPVLIPTSGVKVGVLDRPDATLSDVQTTLLAHMADALTAFKPVIAGSSDVPSWSTYISADILDQLEGTQATLEVLGRLAHLAHQAITSGQSLKLSGLESANVLNTAQILARYFSQAIEKRIRGEETAGFKVKRFSDYPDAEEIKEAIANLTTPPSLGSILHPGFREEAWPNAQRLKAYPFTLNHRLTANGEMEVAENGRAIKVDRPMIIETLSLYDPLAHKRGINSFTPIAAYNAAILRKTLADEYVRRGNPTLGYHYYTNALEGLVAAYNVYDAIIDRDGIPKWEFGDEVLDQSPYNGISREFAIKEQSAVVLEVADVLLRRTLLDRKNPDQVHRLEEQFEIVRDLLEFYHQTVPEGEKNPYAYYLYHYALFQFGEFYQDIIRNPVKAGEQYVRLTARRLPVSVEELTDEIKRRQHLLNNTVAVNTPAGVLKREEHILNLSTITEVVNEATAAFYKDIGAKWVDVPQIVGVTGACENLATLFQIIYSKMKDNPFYGTQTGQLALELSLREMKNVWTRIISLRAEKPDRRHLNQFPLTEEEFSYSQIAGALTEYDQKIMFEALLARIEGVTKAVAREALKHPDILKVYGRNPDTLRQILDKKYLRVTYIEAVKLLKKDFPDLQWGQDLKAPHEREILRVMNEQVRITNLDDFVPLFITEYPTKIKFFNMAVKRDGVTDPNKQVVWSADLIVPYAGEAVGAAVREHEYDVLLERLLRSEMWRIHVENGGTLQQFLWYLDMIRQKLTEPHAGYGMGDSRLKQWLLRLTDNRDCSTAFLQAEATGDWHNLGVELPDYPAKL